MTQRTDTIDFDAVWKLVEAQFSLGPHSLHGPSHWRRVEQNGLLLADKNGADPILVRLFAVFHDSRRVNEGIDDGHGLRGAELARSVRGRHFDLSNASMQKLVIACSLHEKGQVSDDPTIGTCWDADRLDLPRVGARPLPQFMSTSFGRELIGIAR